MNLSDKETLHSYMPVYQGLLAQYRNTPLPILEIGIQNGYSVLAWREYFWRAPLVGVDISPCPVAAFVVDYTHIQGNAYHPDMLNLLRGLAPFAVIIDDGSHAYEDMKFVCANYPHLLSPGGLLVIEDIPDDSWPLSLGGQLPHRWHSEVIDLRATKGRYDDLMLCAWRLA